VALVWVKRGYHRLPTSLAQPDFANRIKSLTHSADGQPYRTYSLVTYESPAATVEQAALDLGLMVTGIFDDQHLTDLHIRELEQGARARG
jgi:hypothetical protein